MGKRGVLLAISSLPGTSGVGDFGNETFEFVKILKKNHFDHWQILPLNPIGYGHSPYQPFSSYVFDEIYMPSSSVLRLSIALKSLSFSEDLNLDS